MRNLFTHIETGIAAGLGILGASLMVPMIMIEDEPGGIPVLMILGSAVWLLGIKIRRKNHLS